MPERLTLGLDDGRPERGDPNYQLDLGRVLRQSFSVTGSNMLSFYLVGLLVYSPALILLAVAAAVPMSAGSVQILVTVSNLLDRFLGLVLAGALAYAVIESLRVRRPAAGQTVAVGMLSAGRVF